MRNQHMIKEIQDPSITGSHSTVDSESTAEPGIASLIQAQSHTLVEINHEIISMTILLLLLTQEA